MRYGVANDVSGATETVMFIEFNLVPELQKCILPQFENVIDQCT
jgi:hypothetical protein